MGETYQVQDQHQVHFLTFQVVGWADVFSRQIYRDIVLESLTYCRSEKALLVFAYVIMTNHMHVIFQHKNGYLSDTIRDFKKYTAKKILQTIYSNSQESRREWLKMIFEYHAKYNKRSNSAQFWTHANHAVALNNTAMLHSRLTYIHQNPVKAGWVARPEDYLYSSARNYAALEAIIKIDSL